MTQIEIIKDNFSQSLRELILCYSNTEPDLVADSAPPSAAEITAIVGLGDEHLRASVAVSVTEADAVVLAGDLVADPKDWIGELSNQLAGRFKNKLSVFGLYPSLSTPTVIQGRDMKVSSPAASHIEFNVNTKDVNLQARLTVEVDAGLELVEDQSAAIMMEGALELF